MTDLIESDARNRLTALDIESFIVEAPAGSGKTELLTQRYLKLLSVVNDPEEIIALTFTNKAAAEMRNRILQSLEAAEKQTPIETEHKQQTRMLAIAALHHANKRGWQLLTQPSRLRIMTMDALCSSLARQMPILSRLGGQPTISEDASLHYLEAAQRTLADVVNETSMQSPISMVLAFMQNDVEKLTRLLSDMLAKREQWLHLAGKQKRDETKEITAQCLAVIRACTIEKLKAALEVFPGACQYMLMPVVRFAASHIKNPHPLKQLINWQEPLTKDPAELGSWLALVWFLLKDNGEFRKPNGLNVNSGFPPDDPDKQQHVETFGKVCGQIKDTKPLYDLSKLPLIEEADISENSTIVQAFAVVLQHAAAHLWQVFQTNNEVDFVAISRSAINALGNDDVATDLALKLDYKISHLLVDEFQDTSPTQIELLEQLTKGWEQNDGRTLFCVGDPMQSIYRFRKAEVSLFLQASNLGVGQVPLKTLKLSRNNRSHPAVVSWINQTFKTVFPQHDNMTEAAISYREFIATKETVDDEGVQIHPLVIAGDEESQTTKAIEANYVADLITKEREQNSSQKIAVLVRSRSHLHELVSEIRRNYPQLKFQAVEIEALNHRQTVLDALSLVRAMLHRADRVHWLNLLRAPWCGLMLADLHALCADNHHATIWQLMHEEARITKLNPDGKTRLLHIRDILEETFTNYGRVPLRRLLENTWLKLGGSNTLISKGDNRDVQAFFDLVEKLAHGNTLDFSELEASMENFYAEPDITASDNLQFLTIHKSKGLEFDCVILPALNRKPRHPDSPLMMWEELQIDGETQLLAAPYTKKKNGTTSLYDYIKQLETTRANHETVRLLYVAATRTIRKLHLVATARYGNDKITPAKNSFLTLLWPNLKENFLQSKLIEPKNLRLASLAEFSPKLMRLPSATTPHALTCAVKRNLTMQNIVPEDKNPLNYEESFNFDADVGTLTHFYLQIIANESLNNWQDAQIKNLIPTMQRWFVTNGYNTNEAHAGTMAVQTHLHNTLSSQQGQWVLLKRTNAANELAIEFVHNGIVSKKIIDRTFVENDVRWIVDYKTASIKSNITEDELFEIANTYRPQLEAYAQLFKKEALSVKYGIFFTQLGRLVVL